jgi:hypothetical protein
VERTRGLQVPVPCKWHAGPPPLGISDGHLTNVLRTRRHGRCCSWLDWWCLQQGCAPYPRPNAGRGIVTMTSVAGPAISSFCQQLGLYACQRMQQMSKCTSTINIKIWVLREGSFQSTQLEELYAPYVPEKSFPSVQTRCWSQVVLRCLVVDSQESWQ